jgi:hypothetical protein
MVETVDQMERIEMGDGQQYASAMSEFPLINLVDPTESYYTYDGVTGRMHPTSFDAESPVGTIDLPSKEDITIQSYKEKFNPSKGVETHLSGIPFSAFARAVSKLQLKIFFTREQIAWRGDEAVDGLIGQYGASAHPDIESDHVINVATAWSDSANAAPYDDIESLAFEIVNNGYLGGNQQVLPNIYMGAETLRDLKQTDDMEGRLPSTNYQQVTTEALANLITENVNNILPVMVYAPREDADGNFIDANGNVVDDADDAAMDNILEPYDPGSGSVQRNVVIGRPGAASAFFPWFLDRLQEREGDVPGEMSIDPNNGFFTQVWNSADPIATYFAAKQEVGFSVTRGENWGVLRGV